MTGDITLCSIFFLYLYSLSSKSSLYNKGSKK